jgi:DNA ligase 1
VRPELYYDQIADTYGKIDATTKRLEMTELLVSLLSDTSGELISRVVYLTQGKLYPDFEGIEIGIAEKLAIKALARACGISENEIEESMQKIGDIGETAQYFLQIKRQSTLGIHKPLTVERVYSVLDKIAKKTGAGAVDFKISLLSSILSDASPKEAKYILRTATGNLRLGIADMTVLDALAKLCSKEKECSDEKSAKETREYVERAYNICSDLGRVAKVVKEKGLEGIRKFKVTVFEPVRPMLAERLASAEEILEKLGGACIAEYKYDGERVQVHKKGDKVILFSRRLERISNQYPDAVELFKRNILADEAIFEGECVAVDLETGEMRPFQELMHRRRKYDIETAITNYPVSLFMFDALFYDGKDLTNEPFELRRSVLNQKIKESDRVKLAEQIKVNSPQKLELFFEKAIENGCEGLVCKSIGTKSVYQAGNRGWLWIKYKRDYKIDLRETLDLVVIGAFHGRGKRRGTYGALLLATYNAEDDRFESITKCGTGFTDKHLSELYAMLQKHVMSHKSSRIRSEMTADVWFEPSIVIEVAGAEITLSPTHACAKGLVRKHKHSGLAIRFPRFTGNYRLDKSPEEATTSKEVLEMYYYSLLKTSHQDNLFDSKYTSDSLQK